jgi:hypothetical protein
LHYKDQGDTVFNNRSNLRYDGVDEYLDANTTTDINGGSAKSVFVVFRTGAASANDMVVYKHGDEDQGLSVVVDDAENIEINLADGANNVVLNYAANAGGTANTGTTYIAQAYFNGSSPAGNSTDNPRVGMAVDNVGGQVAESKWSDGGFNVTTLTTPAIGAANKISLGARSGSVRIDGGTIVTAGRGNYFNGEVAEVIILNTANKSIRDAVYCYLRNKYYGSGNQGVDNDLEKNGDVVAGDETSPFTPELIAYPNPAEDAFTVEAAIPYAGTVTVTLHDAVGRNVMTLFTGEVSNNTMLPIEANVANLPSGAYVVKIQAANDVHLVTPLIVRH